MSLMSLKCPPFRASLPSGREVCWCQIWQVWGLLDHAVQFGSKKLLHLQHVVSGCIVMQQHPAVVLELLISDVEHARLQTSSHC